MAIVLPQATAAVGKCQISDFAIDILWRASFYKSFGQMWVTLFRHVASDGHYY
jgi:hypothetical protein